MRTARQIGKSIAKDIETHGHLSHEGRTTSYDDPYAPEEEKGCCVILSPTYSKASTAECLVFMEALHARIGLGRSMLVVGRWSDSTPTETVLHTLRTLEDQ